MMMMMTMTTKKTGLNIVSFVNVRVLLLLLLFC